jgi:predicted outer membrane protein
MTRRFVVVIAVAGLLGLAACGQSSDTPGAQAADTLSRAQKDSIVAKLPIPGASGVGAAQRARDAANARVQQHDTIH